MIVAEEYQPGYTLIFKVLLVWVSEVKFRSYTFVHKFNLTSGQT